MPQPTPEAPATPVRDVADAYVRTLAEIDPALATSLGTRPDEDRLPDLSPAGQAVKDDLRRSTLAALDALPPEARAADADERRCARLLRERLGAALDMSEAGEHLREVSNIFGPMHQVRSIFTMMPTGTADQWAVVARRLGAVPGALAGYRESLELGASRRLFAAPRQVSTVVGQLGQWLAAGNGAGWFAEFAADADVPAALRADLDTAAAGAARAVAGLRDWMSDVYLPQADGTPDGMGEERYLRSARFWTGARLDLAEVQDWGWQEYCRIRDEMKDEAHRVLPGASPAEAMRYLDEHGTAVDGVAQVRERLQQMMDEAVGSLDGTHFDMAEPIRRVEAMIAPAGSAAAPYYTRPSQDFSRPGRTWLPTLGRTRFPEWSLISTWYHEGVPGHHLQLAQWVHIADRLSVFQTSVGGISACSEGWALYAERLMDELGYLKSPGARLGYLDAQMLRAARIVVDLGMHLGLTVPADSPVGAGQTWTPELAGEFFRASSGEPPAFIDSEIVRYLSAPGQAISYKLGERAWLAGRSAAQAARGASFDLKAWHMAALSLGSLGLDDLTDELARL
ncbi:MAG: DUF885 domain-containing protein [Streptosporangiaceae bacterium]